MYVVFCSFWCLYHFCYNVFLQRMNSSMNRLALLLACNFIVEVCSYYVVLCSWLMKYGMVSSYRLERLNDPDLTLTSSGGRYLGRPSFFGFRVYDVSGGSEQLAGPPVQCARQNELEFRRTVAQGRYQRLHAVCLSASLKLQ